MANKNMDHPTVIADTRDIERKNKAKTELIKIPATLHTTPYLNADSSKRTEQAPEENTAHIKAVHGAGRCNIAEAAVTSWLVENTIPRLVNPTPEISAFVIHLSMSGGALGDFVKYFSQSGPNSRF